MTFGDLIVRAIEVLDAFVQVVVGLGLVGVAWGIALFVLNSGNTEERNKGKGILIWGVVAIFLMLLFEAVVNLLARTLGVL